MSRPDAGQTQFLDVITRDEATARFRAHLVLAPLGEGTVSLNDARGRVLARDIVAAVDVPGFDRSNVDGFAIVASDSTKFSCFLGQEIRLLETWPCT